MKLTVVSSALLITASALADHGPGTSGGGVGTPSGETLSCVGSLSLIFDHPAYRPAGTYLAGAFVAKNRHIFFQDVLGQAVTFSVGRVGLE